MITALIILACIALHILGAVIIIKHRRNVAHHRFSMRPLGRDEASGMLISRAVSRPATPAPEGAGDREEESLRAVTLGQRVIGTLFILGFAFIIILCLSDLS